MDVLGGRTLTIVGAGRMGTALAAALKRSGMEIIGPLTRTDAIHGALVLLVVPDREIANALRRVPAGATVGHTAGALTLDTLGDHQRFSMHPLMTASEGRAAFEGASAAVAGSTPHALDIARALAARLGMRPIEIPENRRASYHAAAAIAANFLVTLETLATRVGAEAGLERQHLLPLARAALENWGSMGAASLTGPIARGDTETVAQHRAAVAAASPEFLAAWDAMAAATARIAKEAT